MATAHGVLLVTGTPIRLESARNQYFYEENTDSTIGNLSITLLSHGVTAPVVSRTGFTRESGFSGPARCPRVRAVVWEADPLCRAAKAALGILAAEGITRFPDREQHRGCGDRW